ncbi:MAG: hypothetical protein AAF636_22750 [Pseudomonadota bacterium]
MKRLNRSELFTFAWTIARQELWSRRLPASELRALFPEALRAAWKEMKLRAAVAAEREQQFLRPSSDLWAAIQALENQSTLGHAGIERLSALQSDYHEARQREAEEKARAEMEAKRKMIASAKGRFVSVTFTKRDGTERQMRIQPATLKLNLIGEAASESARRAVRTRAERQRIMPSRETTKASGLELS